MSVESRITSLIGMLNDVPDWAHMKAIELSRAMDEGDLTGESLAVSLILMTMALDRRIKLLEGDSYLQDHWNMLLQGYLEDCGYVELVPGEIWDTGEEEEDDDDEEEEL